MVSKKICNMLSRVMLIACISSTVMRSCGSTAAAVPGLGSNALLWKRLGLNRAVGEGRPQITSSKKKGESTIYFIKLPPQPHYYTPLNYLPFGNSKQENKDNGPNSFETVSVDFTANGKPENVYHWNLPLGISVPTTTTTTTTPPTTSTTPRQKTTTTPPQRVPSKKPFRQNFFSNGKPNKVYFVKPLCRESQIINIAPAPATPPPQSRTALKNVPSSGKPIKKHFFGNGKLNQLYFVKSAH